MSGTTPRVLVLAEATRAQWTTGISEPVLLLPLGITAEEYSRRHGSRLHGKNVEFVDTAQLASAAQRAVQEMYPSMLYELPRRPIGDSTLLEQLSTRTENLWWYTDISEKSAMRVRLIADVYFAELVRLVREKHRICGIVVDSRRAELHAAFGGASRPALAARGSFVARLLIRRLWWVANLLGQYVVIRAGKLGTRSCPRILFFTSYPINWRNPLEVGRAQERMYGELPAFARARDISGYLAWINESPLWLWRHRRAICNAFERKMVVPLMRYARLRDLFRPLGANQLRGVVAAHDLTRKLPPYTHGDVNLAPLIAAEIERSLLGYELVADVVVAHATQQMSRRERVPVLIHWNEWQPVEKSLWGALRYEETRTVAFQHSACSPMFMQYTFVPKELLPQELLPNRARSRDAMPLPDLLVTTGWHAAEAARTAGYPSSRIRVCGPIRYPELRNNRRNFRADEIAEALSFDSKQPVILLVTGARQSDNRSMLTAFVEAVENRKLVVLVKCHPFARMEKAITDELSAARPRLSVRALDDAVTIGKAVSCATVMVGNSSASGLEAVASGVMPIFFHNPNTYDVNVLYSIADSILLASNSSELALALRQTLDYPESLQWKRKTWPGILRHLVGSLEDNLPEQCCLDFIDYGPQDKVTTAGASPA